MKRFLAVVLLALLPSLAYAQQPPFGMTSANCQQSPVFGNMPFCFDTTTGGINAKNSSGTAYLGAGRTQELGGEAAVNSTSVANFFPISGQFTPAAAAAEGNVLGVANSVSTIKNMNCVLMVAGGTVTVAGGTNYVIALRKNQVDTAVTCTITAAASSCSDTTHSITTAIGDQLDFGATPNGTPTALEAKCSVEQDM